MFQNCKTADEAKTLFRRLAHFLHPDKGGESDLMILLQDEYDMILEFFRNNTQNLKSKCNLKYQNTYENVFKGSDELAIFYEIYQYAAVHPKFETKYIDSLNDYLQNNGYLTSTQYNKLVKIYYAFRMDKEPQK